MLEADSPVADADVNSGTLLAELARVRAMYVALLERSVNDRRRLMQRLADAGLEDPDPKEGIRMELLAAWPWAVDFAPPPPLHVDALLIVPRGY